MIPDNELLAMACEFHVGPEPILNGMLHWHVMYPERIGIGHVYVKNMGNPDPEEPDRWAILKNNGGSCLNKKGEWVYQSLPSNRDDDFYAECRYASVHEAIEYYRQWKAAIEEWGNEQIAKAGFSLLTDPKKRLILNYDDCPKELLKFGAKK